jgi:hypothetical protein
MTMSFNGGGVNGGPNVANNTPDVQGQGVYKNVVQDSKGVYYDLSDPQSAAAYARAMAAYVGPVEVRADGSQWTPDGKQISGPSKDNTAAPGMYTRTPEGSLTSQRDLTDQEQRQAGLGQYAPTNSYGTGAGQYAPMSGPSPTGGVTDPRLGTNYTGEAIDPWSYGGNGGVYKDGQYVPGSNGFDQRAKTYNDEAAQRYADYNGIAGSAAYDASTGDTKSALALQQAAAQGLAPSQAELLGRAQLDQQLSRENSLAASARGGSLNQFAALEQASRNGAGDRQQGLAAIAAMRANEMATARGQYGQTATTMSAQQLSSEEANRQRQLAAMGMADSAQLERQKQADAIQQLGMSAAQAKAQLVTGQATQTSIAQQQINAQQDIASRQADASTKNAVIGGTLAAGGAVGGAVVAGALGSLLGGKPVDPMAQGQQQANENMGGGGTPVAPIGSGLGEGDSTGTGGSAYGSQGQAFDPYADPDHGSDMRSKEDILDLSGRKSPRWYDDMAPSTAPALNRYGDNSYDDRSAQSKQAVPKNLSEQVARLQESIAAQKAPSGSATDAALMRYGDPPIRLTQSSAGERSGGGGPWQRSTSDYESQNDRLARQAQDIQTSIAAQQATAYGPSSTDSALHRWDSGPDVVSDDRAKQDFYQLGVQHGSRGSGTNTLGAPPSNTGSNALGAPPSNTGSMSLGGNSGSNTLGASQPGSGANSLASTTGNTALSGGPPGASGSLAMQAPVANTGSTVLGPPPLNSFMSRSASQFGVGGDILSDNRAKLADAYNLGRAHQMDLSHGGHPDIQFEMSPDIHDHDINPRIAARKKEIERKLRAGQAVPLSDEEAKRSLDDPRAAPPDTYYSEEPGGIARTVTGPRAAPHTYSLPAQMMTNAVGVSRGQYDDGELSPEEKIDTLGSIPSDVGYRTAPRVALPSGKEYAPTLRGKMVSPEDDEIVSDARAKKLANEPMAKANRALKPSGYRYKEEFTPPDQEPGEQNVGPMAQNLAADPVASSAVRKRPNGLLALNRDKLSKLTAGGVGYLQERVDEIEKQIAALKAKRKGA